VSETLTDIRDPRAAPPGRNETDLERCDRNLVELLQELRVVQTGVQVLFAFLLAAPLATRFPQLTAFQRYVYFGTLLATAASAILLIAPTAYHRILFRCGDKAYLVSTANRFMLAGLACVAVSMLGALLLVSDLLFRADVVAVICGVATLAFLVCWCVLPIMRRLRFERPSADMLALRRAARRTGGQ
jgi:hypothetical protein